MRRLALLVLPMLSGVACNQAEPTSGGEPDYFPLRDGASWQYLHSNGGWTETVSVESLSKTDRFKLTTSPDPAGLSEEQTLLRSDGDVFRVGQDIFEDGVLSQSIEYDPGFLRFSTAWTEEQAGFSETRSYQRTATNAGSSPKAPLQRAHVYTLEATSESVTVPAGTFRKCLRVRRARDYDSSAPDGGLLSEEQEKLYWFCPGVGKVREENPEGGSEVLMTYDLSER